ncbi:MAG: hypothetical protein KOO61_06555 [Spirochaetales bacterium]|nr:hypothetical protein [Spirochaetales bacterium]
MRNGMTGAALLLISILLTMSGCSNPMSTGSADARGDMLAPAAAVTGTSAGPPIINEFLADHTGVDIYEYVEIYGDPNTDFSRYTVIEIEGDGHGAGIIDCAFPLGTTNGQGYWATPFCTNDIENGTASLFLVLDFSGSTGIDLDADNDGTFDYGTPLWTSIIDSVAVHDGGEYDRTYGGVTLDGGYDGVFHTVGGASRVPDGRDTDSPSDWMRNDYGGAGLPGFTCFPAGNEALNTPGTVNRPASSIHPIPAAIMEIQGSGASSPLEGQLISTTGVVTLLTPGGRSFWIQDPAGDGDGNTSDGIYVYRGASAGQLEVGDLVSLVARVGEYTPYSRPADLPLTELTNASELRVVSKDHRLPEPIPLTGLPTESIADAVRYWESREGMLVSAAQAPVVGPTSRHGEFSVINRDNAVSGSGYHPGSSHLVLREIGPTMVDYNPERIMVDDLTADEQLLLQPGDVLKTLVGVVDYSYSNYKVQPSEITLSPRRSDNPSLYRRTQARGNLRITTFNVENLFDLFDEPGKDDASSTPDPEELEVKLTKLSIAIIEELLLPEILVVQEVENTAILQALGDRVNREAATDYLAVSFETSDRRGIEPGFLFNRQMVQLIDAFQMTGAEVEAAFGPSSPSPGREPIVGTFDIGGEVTTIIGNHFRSKGGDEPVFGANWPPFRSTEFQRKAQARAVRTYVNALFAEDADSLIVVAGDLNDFQFGEPGEGVDHPVAILEGFGDEIPLTNIINFIHPQDRFTYIYEGNSQVLDHMLASPALLRYHAGENILHFNASYPYAMVDDPTTAHRSSDHDPVEMRLRLK